MSLALFLPCSLWEAVGEFGGLGDFFPIICKLMFGFKQISCSTSVTQFSVNVAAVLSSVNVKHSLYMKSQ